MTPERLEEIGDLAGGNVSFKVHEALTDLIAEVERLKALVQAEKDERDRLGKTIIRELAALARGVRKELGDDAWATGRN